MRGVVFAEEIVNTDDDATMALASTYVVVKRLADKYNIANIRFYTGQLDDRRCTYTGTEVASIMAMPTSNFGVYEKEDLSLQLTEN